MTAIRKYRVFQWDVTQFATIFCVEFWVGVAYNIFSVELKHSIKVNIQVTVLY